ncbi:MAG: NHL repeat-containing protein [Myxococcota bacterium]
MNATHRDVLHPRAMHRRAATFLLWVGASACTQLPLLPGQDAGVPACERNSDGTEPGVVTTLAGNDAEGSSDGQGNSARFSLPGGVAVGPSDVIYVADTANNRIRKVTLAGMVTTFAGSGAGTANGTGAEARFHSPFGLGVGPDGTVYVADTANQRIRKITPAAEVTTLAGSVRGFNNGPGAEALFALPSSAAVDSRGRVIVADTDNAKIRSIDADGVVGTAAGSTAGHADGSAPTARFNAPGGVAADGAGNIYIADTDNHLIRKLAANGQVSTLAGSGEPGSCDGVGAEAAFRFPRGVAVDADGNVYVADTLNHLIRKITPDGTVSTVAGATAQSGTSDGTGAGARFDSPEGVAVLSTGDLVVADTGNNRVRRVDLP